MTERRKGLRRDTEKAREWLRKSRAPLGRDPDKGLRPSRLRRKKPQRPAEGPLTPSEWRRVVALTAGLRCRVTDARARDAYDRRFHAHHPVPKEALRSRGLHAHLWDPRNGVFVGKRVHERHELAVERIPRDVLPATVWEFAAEMDAADGTEWATAMVEREHPPARCQCPEGVPDRVCSYCGHELMCGTHGESCPDCAFTRDPEPMETGRREFRAEHTPEVDARNFNPPAGHQPEPG